MARARNIKPAFFDNEELASCSFAARLLFIGLWTLADKDGRLEDRPLRIKAKIFPYDSVNIEELLEQLRINQFIQRGLVSGVRVIHIPTFTKHQNPHKNEADSVLLGDMQVIDNIDENRDSSNYASSSEKIGSARADSLLLIPDSLIPSSLNPDTLIPELLTPAKAVVAEVLKTKTKAKPKSDPELQTACKTIWSAYSQAFFARYGVLPVRNVKVNSLVKQLSQRLGQEAEHVASFYVGHNNSFYVRDCHGMGPLVKDCEALRTQWLSGNRVTSTKANEADRLQSTGDGWQKLIEEAEEKERNLNVS